MIDCIDTRTPLESLASLVSDAIVDTLNSSDPSKFAAISAAVARYKSEDSAEYVALMNGGDIPFPIFFGAIDSAVAPEC